MKSVLKPTANQKVLNLKGGSLTIRPLKNVKYTGQLMRTLSVKYQNDAAMYGHLSLIQYYDLIKNIPYKPDPAKKEFIQRPYYTLNQRGQGGDCDDKAICIGAYCALASIPFRFVACGKKTGGRLHHVITEVLLDDGKGSKQWLHVDATYSFNTIGKQLAPYPKRLVISRPYPVLDKEYPYTYETF